jgi:hypothetical protein
MTTLNPTIRFLGFIMFLSFASAFLFSYPSPIVPIQGNWFHASFLSSYQTHHHLSQPVHLNLKGELFFFRPGTQAVFE